MKLLVLFISVFNSYYCFAQLQDNPKKNIPVFRQVSYPILPALSSAYFFFSEDGLMWFSTVSGLASFDGTETVYHYNIQNYLNLKSIHVLKLIIQLVIENVIWHGIIPRNNASQLSSHAPCKDGNIQAVNEAPNQNKFFQVELPMNRREGTLLNQNCIILY